MSRGLSSKIIKEILSEDGKKCVQEEVGKICRDFNSFSLPFVVHLSSVKDSLEIGILFLVHWRWNVKWFEGFPIYLQGGDFYQKMRKSFKFMQLPQLIISAFFFMNINRTRIVYVWPKQINNELGRMQRILNLFLWFFLPGFIFASIFNQDNKRH